MQRLSGNQEGKHMNIVWDTVFSFYFQYTVFIESFIFIGPTQDVGPTLVLNKKGMDFCKHIIKDKIRPNISVCLCRPIVTPIK